MDEDVVKFFFEMAQLKRIKHEGWRLAGVECPDSVAEHSLRAAQLAYLLADAEGHAGPERATMMLVFHDIGETRIGDIHRVGRRYMTADEAAVVKEQTARLGEMGKRIRELWNEFEDEKTEIARVAKDADRLEQALTAKEYMERGYAFAEDWIKNIRKVLYTETAKRWLEKINKMNSNDWWQGLKKLDIHRAP